MVPVYVDTGASVVVSVASKLGAKAAVNGEPDSPATLSVSATGEGVIMPNEKDTERRAMGYSREGSVPQRTTGYVPPGRSCDNLGVYP